MKNVTSRTIGIGGGTYGPRHDPYGYTEYKMNSWYSDGTEIYVVVHTGLIFWIDSNDGSGKVELFEKDYLDWVTPMGLTIREFIDAVIIAKNRRTERCSECNSRKVYGQDGYPGEYLYICADCNTLCDSDFNLSAVA